MVLALACTATWRSHESHDAKAETTPVRVVTNITNPSPAVLGASISPMAVSDVRPVAVEPTSQPEATVSAAAVGTLTAIQTSPATEGSTGVLSSEALDALLSAAGWPSELWEQAKRVIECESHGNPNAVGDSGRSVGLFQLNKETWFTYAGEDPEQWADPLVNARTALIVVHYDIERGYAPFKQWSCSPN